MPTLKRHHWINAALFVVAAIHPHWVNAARQNAVPEPALRATLTATPNETRGKTLFDSRCAGCHQSDARGSGSEQVPALAGQQYEYLVKQLIDFNDLERANATMHKILAQSGISNTQSMADVAGYVANLPANPAPDKGNGAAIQLGKRIFDSSCLSCHGPTAEGNADLWIPNLRGQHYGYLLKQMKMMANTKRSNISEDLHRTFRNYAPQELEAVADYLTRMTN